MGGSIGCVAQLVEYLPQMPEALGSIPSTVQFLAHFPASEIQALRLPTVVPFPMLQVTASGLKKEGY